MCNSISSAKSNAIHIICNIQTTATMKNMYIKLIFCDVISSGGLILLVGREKDVLTIEEYKDRLEPLMKQLEDERKWTMLERTVFPGYFPEVNGIVFVFKVTK